jgi:4-hydroxybenzoate polyprenyltransferase
VEELKKQIPLTVDLDGSLISTDLSEESIVKNALKRPWSIFLLLILLLQGRARLKQYVASKLELNIESLPFKTEVLEWLTQQKESGRSLYLVSGSDQHYVDQVSSYLNLFTKAWGSDGKTNLIGKNKAKKLVSEFGEKGFDYLGNSSVDLKVWQHSNAAVVVSSSAKLISKAERVSKVFNSNESQIKGLIKSMRFYQWSKSLLVFVPILASHKLLDLPVAAASILAFISFGFAASSGYILNDISDLTSDRLSESKKKRPFACGQVRVSLGLALGIALLLLSLLLASFLPKGFILVLILYYLAVMLYSAYLKRGILIDLLLLAGFYSLRVMAGGLATGIDVSRWLLLFSVFFFFSLACVKRFVELSALTDARKVGRAYYSSDTPVILGMGLCSGFISTLVVALWANSPEVSKIYLAPQWLWLLCPLMVYWIGRVWILAARQEMHQDPVLFALKDKLSFLVYVAGFCLVYLAATSPIGLK